MTLSTSIPQGSLFFHSEWSPSELRILHPPEDLSAVDHAEKYFYVVKSSREGLFRRENNPPLIGVISASDKKGVFGNMRVMVVRKGVQTGGSLGLRIILSKRMDGSASSALFVMENERKVKRSFKQYFIESFKKHGRLKEQMSSNPDDTTNYSISMGSGFCLNAGWAGSQASVATDPCETVILDELDKYESDVNIEEAKDRITTYPETGLVILNSTPGEEDGPITREFDECDAIMDFHVECPECGQHQVMDWENFTWPGKGETLPGPAERKKLANRIIRNNLARYICNGCGVLWDDYDRNKAVRLGALQNFHGWKMREDIPNPASVGFSFPSWISPFKSLSHVVARKLKAEGDPKKMRMWHNQEAAQPYAEGQEAVNPDTLFARVEPYAAEVPMPVRILTAAVDTQKGRIEVEVKGWAPGEESFGIVHKVIQGSFLEQSVQDALDDFLLKTFRHESGETLTIKRAFIDSGGYYSSQVYAFCKAREGRGVYAIKGSSDPRADILDGKMVRRKDAIFQKIGVTSCKDILFNRLALDNPGPGYMHFSNTYDREYFNQFAAERVTKSKKKQHIYEQIPGKKNEAIDLNNYNLAALRHYNPDWETLRRTGIGAIDRSSLVYRHHERTKHQSDAITLMQNLPLIVCCDFNKTLLVWVLAQTDGKKVWCIDEVALRNATTMDMAMEVNRRYGQHRAGFIVYGSANGTVRGSGGKTEYAILAEMGFRRQVYKKTNPPLIDQVNAVNNMLEDLSGLSRLSYHPNCTMLRKDFEQAIWLEDRSEMDRTDLGRGNAAGALGNFINYEWPLKAAMPNPGRRFYK